MNKPCANCVKVTYPCSYAAHWTPQPHRDGGAGNGGHTDNLEDEVYKGPKIRSDLHSNSSSPTGSGAIQQSNTEPPPPATHLPPAANKNPWLASLVKQMVLMPRLEYEELLPLQLQRPSHSALQVSVAPVVLGMTGQMALNSNIGVVRGQLHEPQYPGILPYNVMKAKLVEFEPHIVKLVKNDFVGVNPYQDKEEFMVFQAPFTRSDPDLATVWDHDGVFMWRTLQKKDIWLRLILKYTAGEKQDLREGFRGSELPNSADHGNLARKMGSFDDGANALGLMLHDGNIQVDLKLCDQMKQMLPPQRVVWTLVKRYFQMLYPFCPAVDEIEFRTAVTRIIGPELYSKGQVTAHVTSRIDSIHLASLLAVLRFSFVSLFSNRQGATETVIQSTDPIHQELKYLFTYPIDVNAIDICKSCFTQFLFLQNVTVPLFLLGLLLRAYRSYAPEEGAGLDDSTSMMLSSALVNMGYSLGFNRDPLKFPGQIDARKTNFIRKTWIFLCITDMYQGYRFGSPTAINFKFFDTQFPSIDDGTENVFDKELDRAVTKIFNISDVLIDGAMKQIVDVSLNVRTPAYLSFVTSLLNMLETCTTAVFGSLQDYLKPLETYNAAYSYGKLMKSSILLSMQIFFTTMLMHIAGYYREKDNCALYYYYSKKLCHVVCNEIMAVVPAFVTKLEDLFGDGVSIFMNPLIIDAVYRANEIFISHILKGNNYVIFRQKSHDHAHLMATDADYFTHFSKVTELVALLRRFCKLCMVIESILSKRYFSAWKTFKSHQRFVLAMADPKFYEFAGIEPLASATEGLHNFSSMQLQEIIDIVRKGLLFVEEQVAKNSESLSVAKIWGHSVKSLGGSLSSPDPEMARNSQPLQFSPTPAPPDQPQQPNQSGKQAGDAYEELDMQFFAHVDGFNDEVVDNLWEQLSTHKLEISQQVERAPWGLYDIM